MYTYFCSSHIYFSYIILLFLNWFMISDKYFLGIIFLMLTFVLNICIELCPLIETNDCQKDAINGIYINLFLSFFLCIEHHYCWYYSSWFICKHVDSLITCRHIFPQCKLLFHSNGIINVLWNFSFVLHFTFFLYWIELKLFCKIKYHFTFLHIFLVITMSLHMKW